MEPRAHVHPRAILLLFPAALAVASTVLSPTAAPVPERGPTKVVRSAPDVRSCAELPFAPGAVVDIREPIDPRQPHARSQPRSR